MLKTFSIRAILVISAIVAFSSVARAQVPTCSANYLTLQNMIDVDIKPNVLGGILATTAHSLMTVQNNCYMNTNSYNSNALAALANPINSLNGLCTYGNCGGGGGGGGGSNTMTFTTKAAFQSALSSAPPLFIGSQFVTVEAVATPSANYATCGVTYAWQSAVSTVYGVVTGVGGPSGFAGYWVPQYGLNPVETCQFGAYGNSGYNQYGVIATGTTTAGSNIITTSSYAGFYATMYVESMNWHSAGSAAIPLSTVTGVGTGTITVSNNMTANATVNIIGVAPLVPGGVDQTAPIKAAIAYAIANKVKPVHVADGNYMISDTLQIGLAGISATSSVDLYGDHSPSFVAAAQPGGASFICTAGDRPCVNIRNGRYSSFHGIGVWGPAGNYDQWAHATTGVNIQSSDPLDYLDQAFNATGSTPGGWQQHSPLAGITVDACSDAAPAAPYPSCGSYGDGYSTGAAIYDVSGGGFPVLIAVGLNTNGQGDYTKINRVSSSYGILIAAIGNSQSRLPDINGLIGSGLYAAFSNDMIGMGTGTIGASMKTLQCAECFELAHIALAYSGPVEIDGAYSENNMEIATVTGGSGAGSLVIKNLLVNMYEANTRIIPPCYINIGSLSTVVLKNVTISGSQRVTNLSCGGGTLLIEDAATIQGGLAGAGGLASVQQAINATGGLFTGDMSANVGGTNMVSSRIPVQGSYFSTPSASLGVGFYGPDVSFAQGGNALTRSQLSPYSTGWIDSSFYHWQTLRNSPGWLNGGAAITSASLSGDVLTFTEPAGNNYWKQYIRPGYILMYGGGAAALNDTVWIVLTNSCTGMGGVSNCLITAKQQNNMVVDGSVNYVSQLDPNLLTDLTASGYLFIYPTDRWAPKEVEYGALSAANATGINKGDGSTCANLAAGYSVGDVYESPPFDTTHTTNPWPFTNGNYNTIASINTGACSMTFSGSNATSSLTPILQVRAH